MSYLNKDYGENDEIKRWRSLAKIDLSNNRIGEFTGVKAFELKEINLNGNDVRRVDKFEGHEKLERLILSNNQLTDSSKLRNMPNLKEIYLVS